MTLQMPPAYCGRTITSIKVRSRLVTIKGSLFGPRISMTPALSVFFEFGK
jgi:hypothetical protein